MAQTIFYEKLLAVRPIWAGWISSLWLILCDI